MHPKLQEVDTIYRTVEPFFYSDKENKNAPHSIDNIHDPDTTERMSLKYQYAIEQFQHIAATLSEQELIEAYMQGSKLLQMNISGCMARNFTDAYIPLMINALRFGHIHTSRTFIFMLARELTHTREAFLQEILQHSEQAIRIEAIYNIVDLDIHTLLPHIQQLTQDKDEEIAQISARVLKKYYGSRKSNDGQ